MITLHQLSDKASCDTPMTEIHEVKHKHWGGPHGRRIHTWVYKVFIVVIIFGSLVRQIPYFIINWFLLYSMQCNIQWKRISLVSLPQQNDWHPPDVTSETHLLKRSFYLKSNYCGGLIFPSTGLPVGNVGSIYLVGNDSYMSYRFCAYPSAYVRLSTDFLFE